MGEDRVGAGAGAAPLCGGICLAPGGGPLPAGKNLQPVWEAGSLCVKLAVCGCGRFEGRVWSLRQAGAQRRVVRACASRSRQL